MMIRASLLVSIALLGCGGGQKTEPAPAPAPAAAAPAEAEPASSDERDAEGRCCCAAPFGSEDENGEVVWNTSHEMEEDYACWELEGDCVALAECAGAPAAE
jgi:hypothetical protein